MAKVETVFSRALGIAISTWGSGWGRLSVEQKRTEIGMAALRILAGQDAEISDGRVRELLNETHAQIEEWHNR